MPTQVQSAASIFDHLLGEIEDARGNEDNFYPFWVRVGVIKSRPPRHEFFDYIRDMGRPLIPKILSHSSLGDRDELTFVFPERWMSLQEQQGFMRKLIDHPDIGGIERVDILTSAPLIVSDFLRENIRIITWTEDQ